jgi:two-component sensor histidine kinase
MKKLFIAIGLVFSMLITVAQENSKRVADSLLNVVNKNSSTVAGRMHALTALAEYQVLKPGEFKADFDTAENYLRQVESINRNSKSSEADGYLLYVRSMLAKERGQREKGKEIVKIAIDRLKNGNNKSYFAKANFELATYYDYTQADQLTEMIRLVEIAVAAFRQTTNVERYAYSLQFLGDLYLNQNDFLKSREALDSSLAAYNSIQYQNLSGVYTLYGTLFRLMRNHRQALKYSLMAMKNAESMGDTSMLLCQIYNTIGNLYVVVKDPENGLVYFDKALRVALQYRDTTSVLVLMCNIVSNQLSLKKYSEAIGLISSMPQGYFVASNNDNYSFVLFTNFNIQLKLGNYEKARKFSSEFIEFGKKHNIDAGLLYNFNNLMVHLFFATRQYSRIDDYISKMEKYRPGSAISQMDTYRLRFRKDTTVGNYRSAISNILRYIQIDDSVFNETNTRQRKELEVEYETIKKEDSIQLKNKDILLLTQKNKLQQINLTQDRLYKNIAIAGGCLLAIILSLVYRQYRQKQKNNTVITRKNEQLQHYLDEKEWLLKEIHHRVKNNLQIVMSLLNSQSAYIDNEPARKAIHDSQHRVYAMSLIHQKLYGGENLAAVSLPVYIRELGTYLAESFDTGNRIHIVYDIAPLEMDVGQAVPLGLILNEAITNAIKYAFPGEMTGTITISLVSLPIHQYLLSVSDNGVGMPAPSIARTGSLGMSLMQGLTVDLDGRFSIEHKNGTTIRITFTHERTIDHLRSMQVVSSN